MTLSEVIKNAECAIIKHGDIELYDEHLPLAKIKELHVFDDVDEKKAVFI